MIQRWCVPHPHISRDLWISWISYESVFIMARSYDAIGLRSSPAWDSDQSFWFILFAKLFEPNIDSRFLHIEASAISLTNCMWSPPQNNHWPTLTVGSCDHWSRGLTRNSGLEKFPTRKMLRVSQRMNQLNKWIFLNPVPFKKHLVQTARYCDVCGAIIVQAFFVWFKSYIPQKSSKSHWKKLRNSKLEHNFWIGFLSVSTTRSSSAHSKGMWSNLQRPNWKRS